jgi:hypothetical protein
VLGEELIVAAAVRMVEVFWAGTAFAGAVVVVVGAGAVVVVTGAGSWTGTGCSVVVVPPPTTCEVGEDARALAADCVVVILGCSSR